MEDFRALIERAIQTTHQAFVPDVSRIPASPMLIPVLGTTLEVWCASTEGAHALRLLQVANRYVTFGIREVTDDAVIVCVLDAGGAATHVRTTRGRYIHQGVVPYVQRQETHYQDLVLSLFLTRNVALEAISTQDALLDWVRGEIAKIANEIIERRGA